MEKDKDFVEFIVKQIVNHPEDVMITRQVDEMGVLLSVKVHKEDMGLLIGRQGSTAKAIRTLVRIIGTRNNARVNLRIEEPEGGRMMDNDSNKPQSVEDVMGELGGL
ncbi:MAG TPA: KH domain-containing protein [Candidatus Paceibacterota bacterium]|nr:KH domain-containing protein [Candidatus Paceibacterota bacterium]